MMVELARRTRHAMVAHGALPLLVLALGCQALGYTRSTDLPWLAATSAAVLLGARALGWLRPHRSGLTAPQAMLLLGAVGMLLGLALDCRTTDPATLASLCSAARQDLLSMLRLHWTLLPWMHAGMWLGGFTAIPLLRSLRPTCRRQYCARVAQNLACSAWMTVGMSAGVLLSDFLVPMFGHRSPASMLGGMVAGMVWGMVASVALYRLFFGVLRIPALGAGASAANGTGAEHR